jgi:hypothetical protein
VAARCPVVLLGFYSIFWADKQTVCACTTLVGSRGKYLCEGLAAMWAERLLSFTRNLFIIFDGAMEIGGGQTLLCIRSVGKAL